MCVILVLAPVHHFTVGQTNCSNCSVGQIACKPDGLSSAICLNSSNVCDGKYDCPLREDEAKCEVVKSQTFQCADKKQYIPKYQQCDSESRHRREILIRNAKNNGQQVVMIREISCYDLGIGTLLDFKLAHAILHAAVFFQAEGFVYLCQAAVAGE